MTMASNRARLIAIARQKERTKLAVVSKGLVEAQRNHHMQERLLRPDTTQHYGQHWQHCPAMSCRRAWSVLNAVGYFSEKQQQARARAGEKLAAKLGLEGSLW